MNQTTCARRLTYWTSSETSSPFIYRRARGRVVEDVLAAASRRNAPDEWTTKPGTRLSATKLRAHQDCRALGCAPVREHAQSFAAGQTKGKRNGSATAERTRLARGCDVGGRAQRPIKLIKESGKEPDGDEDEPEDEKESKDGEEDDEPSKEEEDEKDPKKKAALRAKRLQAVRAARALAAKNREQARDKEIARLHARLDKQDKRELIAANAKKITPATEKLAYTWPLAAIKEFVKLAPDLDAELTAPPVVDETVAQLNKRNAGVPTQAQLEVWKALGKDVAEETRKLKEKAAS